MDQGMRVLSYLISGVLLYGALGWVGDHFLHTSFLLPIGIVLGAGSRHLPDDQAAGSDRPGLQPAAGPPTTTTEGDR